MSRKTFKEINPFEHVQHNSCQQKERPFQWSLCILCQNNTKESLQCPARSKRADLVAGYHSMAENLQGLFAIGAFPFDVNPNHLDDGSGLCNTLLKHEASWHKSCKDKINSTKLKRAEKRKIYEEPSPHSPRKTRRTSSFGPSNCGIKEEEMCFFLRSSCWIIRPSEDLDV